MVVAVQFFQLNLLNSFALPLDVLPRGPGGERFLQAFAAVFYFRLGWRGTSPVAVACVMAALVLLVVQFRRQSPWQPGIWALSSAIWIVTGILCVSPSLLPRPTCRCCPYYYWLLYL